KLRWSGSGLGSLGSRPESIEGTAWKVWRAVVVWLRYQVASSASAARFGNRSASMRPWPSSRLVVGSASSTTTTTGGQVARLGRQGGLAVEDAGDAAAPDHQLARRRQREELDEEPDRRHPEEAQVGGERRAPVTGDEQDRPGRHRGARHQGPPPGGRVDPEPPHGQTAGQADQ